MKKMEKMSDVEFAHVAFRYPQHNMGDIAHEVWLNDKYEVHVRKGLPFAGIEGATMTHLSIKRLDRRALVDWREFQWIKNDIVGPENEGVELFPAESRLVDGANQYHIWVFEDPSIRWPLGWGTRLVSEESFYGETQRAWPTTRKPTQKDFDFTRNFHLEHQKK